MLRWDLVVIGVGVVGYGYWGPNLVRNFAGIAGARVVAVSDLNGERLAQAEARYPGIRTTRDFLELLRDPAVDAVAIATPISTHFSLALQALQAGKHVLVEKPLAPSSDEALRLIDEADRRRRVLMVDHTFLYTGAVRKIRELVETGRLGHLYYYDSVRVNLGLFHPDVNVLWDLAVHDLSIMDYVVPHRPCAVSVTGVASVGQMASIAYLTCFFENNFIAHFHVNWLAPVKVRRTLLCGDRQMIVYDDLEPDEKIKIYDRGITVRDATEGGENPIYQSMVDYRSGDMWAPRVDRTEALQNEALHFVECIQTGARPMTDGESGLRIVRILEAAERSLAQGGRRVELEEPLSLQARRLWRAHGSRGRRRAGEA